MIELENRPFEARFGERCPFCNKTWGDPNPCGDSRADRTIQQSLKLLFADRVVECDACGVSIPAGRVRCFDCAKSRRLELGRQKVARYRARHQVIKHCPCGKTYNTYKKDQKHCSLSCANRYSALRRNR